MMLFRRSLLAALFCAGTCANWAIAHSCVTEVKEAGETGGTFDCSDSARKKHETQVVAPVPSAVTVTGGDRLKEKYGVGKLPTLQSVLDEHSFSLRRHAATKPADATGILFDTEAGKERTGKLSNVETLVREERVKYSAPAIGNLIPLMAGPSLGSRYSGTWQPGAEQKEKLSSPECKRAREWAPAAGETAFVHPAASSPIVYVAEDSIQSKKPKVSLKEFVKEMVKEASKGDKVVLPLDEYKVKDRMMKHSSDEDSETKKTDHMKKYSSDEDSKTKEKDHMEKHSSDEDCKSKETDHTKKRSGDSLRVNGFHQRSKCGDGARSCAFQAAKPARFEALEGNPEEDCARSEKSSKTDGRRHFVVLGEESSPLLTGEEIMKPLPQKEVVRPSDVAVHVKSRRGRSAACGCGPTCKCQSSGKGLGDEGKGSGLAQPYELELDSIVTPKTLNGADKSSPLPEKIYTETDQVKVVRGTIPLFSGAHVRGEPLQPGKTHAVPRPTLQPARPSAQHQIARPSTSAFSTPPLAQLEELFLNVGGPLLNFPVATEILGGRVQSQSLPTDDGTTPVTQSGGDVVEAQPVKGETAVVW